MTKKIISAIPADANFELETMNFNKDNVVSDAVYKIISDIIPKLNSLVEVNVAQISDSFSNIAVLCKKISGSIEPETATELEKNIGNAIMGMQFQDRLSQNLVIIKKGLA